MTILHKNLILRSGEICLTILNVNLMYNEVALLNISDDISWPFIRPIEEIEDDVLVGNYKCEDCSPPTIILDTDFPLKWIEYRDSAWNIIRDFVENHTIAYFKRDRCEFTKKACIAHGITRATVNKYLQMYWRGGMIRNALLPRWNNCGAPGVEREPGVAKRGRPRTPGGKPGPNTTLQMRRWFRIAINLFYKKNRNFDLTQAYDKCIELFFCERFVSDDGVIHLQHKEEFRETGFPSFAIFAFHVRKDMCFQSLEKARLGAAAYEMRYRAKLDTATADSWGPGARYAIDATLVDVTLRSRRFGPHGRTRVLGNPVIYVVIDVFSRMIVGIYVGWENPSWRAAIMAIANVFEDKVEFCKSLGIEITEDQWPCRHKPTVILGDRAEMMSQNALPMIEALGIGIESTPPYRADWKGTVESRFHILQQGFRPFVPGSRDRSRKVRGDRDPRLDAVLDIDEFYTIIVDLVLYHNNFHILENYPRPPGMTEAGVPSIPLHIWKWGLPARAGEAKTPELDEVRFALLWRGDASLSSEGIKFCKMRYKSDDPSVHKWICMKGKKVHKVEIAYDDRNMNTIYLNVIGFIKNYKVVKQREAGGLPPGWVVCTLSTASEDYRNLTQIEVEGVAQDKAELHARFKEQQILRRVEWQARTDEVVQRACTEVKSLPEKSVKSTLESMRENRAEERSERRRGESAAFTASFRPGSTGPAVADPVDGSGADADFDLSPMQPSDWEASYER